MVVHLLASASGIEFRILGPLEVLDEGRPVALGGSKPRALLAVLLLHANEPLTTDRLIDELWGEHAPPTAAKAVHVHVSRLRKALAAGAGNGGAGGLVITRERGYELRLDPERVDSRRFEQLVAEGRSELADGRPQRALAALEAALSLWRGEPLADLAYEPFAQREIARLDDLRVDALEQLAEAKLALGRHAEAVGELEALIRAHPYREGLRARLMLALYRCERQADALEAYQDARRTLVEELGIEPGERLRELERAILAQDPELAAPELARPERVFELRSRAGAPQEEPGNESVRVELPLPRPLRFPAGASFVGREAELGRLRGLWAGVSGGEQAAAFLAGEAGIGKTRLAAELARALQEEGALVLYGRCDEGLAVPYQPFVEALRPYARAIGLDRLRVELGPLAPQFGRLLPELEGLGEPAGGDPESARFALFEAVTGLLEAATRAQPVLLVLDDLHWAAPPTLLMLRHLIRSERTLGGLVLGTYRETEVNAAHPLSALRADLQRDASTTTVRVGGLDERGIAALLEAAAGHVIDEPGREFARVLQSGTGGNPFFIREVLAHLVESGAIYRAGGRWTTDLGAAELEVPEGLRQVIGDRVARLPEPARRALGVAAVAGPGFTLALLEAVQGKQADLLDGLDQAASAGLLAETGPAEYAFAHALVRQTIYDAHGSARRARLHRQLGEALEALGDADSHVEALAHHFAEAAADGQAAKAATYALVAGRRASARLAFEDAAAHYERGLQALQLAPAPEEERRGELLLALGVARWNVGDMDRAREACRLAAELAERRGEPEQFARAALAHAGPPWRFEAAAAVTGPLIDLLERALEALGDDDSALRARVMARLAFTQRFSDPERRRPELSRQALDRVRRVGDRPELVAEAAALRALGEYFRGESLSQARAALAEAHRLIDELTDDELAGCVRAAAFAGQASFGMECHAAAGSILARGLAVARATGQQFWLVLILSAYAISDLWRARLRTAAEHAEAAVEASTVLGNDQLQVLAQSVLCWVRTLRGELDDALKSGSAARSAHSRAPASAVGWLPHCTYAAALVDVGDAAQASAVILAHAGGEELAAIEPSFRVHWYEVLARAELTRGGLEAAAGWLDRADRLAAAFPLTGRCAEVARGRAQLALAEGIPDRAVALAEEATRGFRECDQPLDAAVAELVAGRALAGAAQPEAEARLRRAREQLASYGAAGYVREADRELRRLAGASPEGRPDSALAPGTGGGGAGGDPDYQPPDRGPADT
jgi:DNA-binding SARP family transcriptional activator